MSSGSQFKHFPGVVGGREEGEVVGGRVEGEAVGMVVG